MNKLLAAAVLSLLVGIASAQEAPLVEVYGGYNFAREFDPAVANYNGFKATVEENTTHILGLCSTLALPFTLRRESPGNRYLRSWVGHS